MSALIRCAAALWLAAAAFVLPVAAMDIQVVKSPGGIEAWLVESRGLPIISLHAGFDGGGRLDPQGKEGLAYLTSTLMNEGAGEFDSTAFMQKLDDKAIRFGASSDSDAFYLSLTTLSDNKAEAFDMMRLAIASPRFDQEAIERMKAQIFSYQKRLDEDPGSIANATWAERAFPGHPYGRRNQGTADSISAITRDDIAAYAAGFLGRDRLRVVVVGDIGADELGPLLDTLFAPIPASRAAGDPPVINLANAGKMDIVQRDIPQSVVVFGGPGIPMTDPDYRAAQVMNYILGGGGFASRLMQELRAKRGLTYGVGTGLSAYRLGDIYFGSFATDNARVKEAIDLTKSEIVKLRDGGATAEEVADAKAYLTGSYPLRFDSNAKIASGLIGLYMSGFDKDYINRRNAEIEAVTVEQVNAVTKRLLDPNGFYFVVVGKPEGL